MFASPKVEADRNELHARVTSLRNMVSNVEDQLKQTSAQLSMAKDSNLELEAEVNKVQLTADQAQRTAEDMERRLNRRAGELQASEEKCAQLERRIGNVFLTVLLFRQYGKLITYFATLVKVWKINLVWKSVFHQEILAAHWISIFSW